MNTDARIPMTALIVSVMVATIWLLFGAQHVRAFPGDWLTIPVAFATFVIVVTIIPRGR